MIMMMMMMMNAIKVSLTDKLVNFDFSFLADNIAVLNLLMWNVSLSVRSRG